MCRSTNHKVSNSITFICDTNVVDEELTPTIINGELIAKEIRSSIAEEVRQMKQAIDKVPGLAVILVGQRRDSQSYVRCKIKACEEVGISSRVAEFPVDCNDNEIVNAVSSFNEDPSVHGILVQLPLPQVISLTTLQVLAANFFSLFSC